MTALFIDHKKFVFHRARVGPIEINLGEKGGKFAIPVCNLDI